MHAKVQSAVLIFQHPYPDFPSLHPHRKRKYGQKRTKWAKCFSQNSIITVCVCVCVYVCVRARVCVIDIRIDLEWRGRGVEGEIEKGRVGERKERGRELVPEKQNIHCYRKEIRKTLWTNRFFTAFNAKQLFTSFCWLAIYKALSQAWLHFILAANHWCSYDCPQFISKEIEAQICS